MRGTLPNPQRQYATAADYWSDIDRFSIARDDSAVVVDGLCSPLRGRACCLHEEADLSELVGVHGLGDSDGPTLYSRPITHNREEALRYERYGRLKPLESAPYKPPPPPELPPRKPGVERRMRIDGPGFTGFAVFTDGECTLADTTVIGLLGRSLDRAQGLIKAWGFMWQWTEWPWSENLSSYCRSLPRTSARRQSGGAAGA